MWRLIFSSPRCSHTAILLRELHWLPVSQYIVIQLLLLCFKTFHGKALDYLMDPISFLPASRYNLHRNCITVLPHFVAESTVAWKIRKRHNFLREACRNRYCLKLIANCFKYFWIIEAAFLYKFSYRFSSSHPLHSDYITIPHRKRLGITLLMSAIGTRLWGQIDGKLGFSKDVNLSVCLGKGGFPLSHFCLRTLT